MYTFKSLWIQKKISSHLQANTILLKHRKNELKIKNNQKKKLNSDKWMAI